MAEPKSRKKKKYIRSLVSGRGRKHLEVLFDYDLWGRKVLDYTTAQDQHYEVDLYMFFPPHLGVGKASWPKDTFYEDLRPFMRFSEPRYGFKDFERRVFVRFDHYLHDFLHAKPMESASQMAAECLIFGCAFHNFAMRRVSRCVKWIQDPRRYDKGVAIAMNSSRKTFLLIARWRKLRRTFESHSDVIDDRILKEMAIVDEFCSMRVRDAIGQMLHAIQQGPEQKKLERRLYGFFRLEKRYAELQGWMWMDAQTDSTEVEEYAVHRRSLKRHVWRVLFLDTRTPSLFALKKQSGYIIAAGVAALWASVAQVMMVRQIQYGWEETENWGLGVLIMASIIAYILKDRIKDVLRDRFAGGILGRLPDRSERVWYTDADGEKVVVGDLQEVRHFLKEEEFPKNLEILREDVFGEKRHEVVVHYRKTIKLYAMALKCVPHLLRGVRDIQRLSLDRWRPHLDAIQSHVYTVEPGKKTIEKQLPGVSYVDILVSHTRVLYGQKLKPELQVIRAVLDRDGLCRVDHLATQTFNFQKDKI
ncbi:MAG: hypothetical protein AB8C84_08270 [Oligoflexales bacterium]